MGDTGFENVVGEGPLDDSALSAPKSHIAVGQRLFNADDVSQGISAVGVMLLYSRRQKLRFSRRGQKGFPQKGYP